jgi:hypothetical protein
MTVYTSDVNGYGLRQRRDWEMGFGKGEVSKGKDGNREWEGAFAFRSLFPILRLLFSRFPVPFSLFPQLSFG